MFADNKSRRSKFEIYLDILDATRNTHKPTRIMYQCNLSWKSLKEAMSYLAAKGLIEETVFPAPQDKRTRYTYHTTQRGLDLLESHYATRRIYEALEI